MAQSDESTPEQLAGPRVPPKRGGAPRQLVILLHGVGADGNDLIQLAPWLQDSLPDAAFFSPHAPYPFDMAPMGRQWFSFRDDSYEGISRAVAQTYATVDRALDAEIQALGLTAQDIALVGFSQGGMMALQTGLRRREPLACVIGLSTILPNAETLAQEITSRPPVLLLHGDQDPVLPVRYLSLSEQALQASAVPVTARVLAGRGHEIDREGLDLVRNFLVRHLLGDSSG